MLTLICFFFIPPSFWLAGDARELDIDAPAPVVAQPAGPELDWNEEIPFDEIVGLGGPLRNLFENLLWVSVLFSVMLFVLAAFPFNLGKFIVLAGQFAVVNPVLQALIGYVLVLTGVGLYLLITTQENTRGGHIRDIVSFLVCVGKVGN